MSNYSKKKINNIVEKYIELNGFEVEPENFLDKAEDDIWNIVEEMLEEGELDKDTREYKLGPWFNTLIKCRKVYSEKYEENKESSITAKMKRYLP